MLRVHVGCHVRPTHTRWSRRCSSSPDVIARHRAIPRGVNEYAETILAQRLSTVDGVSQVNVYGAQKYAVRVRLDPQALAARGIGLDEVRSALDANNVNLPSGTLDGTYKSTTLLATGQLNSAEGFRKVIVSYRNGAAVRLADVANVIDSIENDKSLSWFDQRFVDGEEDPDFASGKKAVRAITLSIQRQPGTNTIKVDRKSTRLNSSHT